MAFNWQISVGTPVLTTGMSFLVRYKKEPTGSWVNFLPNPTTNTFIIPNLSDGKYTAEIKLLCTDGSISAPKYTQTNCGDQGTAPLVNIFWFDTNLVDSRPCLANTIYPIGFNSFDQDGDIVLIELQRSTDGLLWTTIGILSTNDNHIDVDANTNATYKYRFRVTDNQNNLSLSNVLQISCVNVSGSGSGSGSDSGSDTGSDSGSNASDPSDVSYPDEGSDGGAVSEP